MPRFILHTLKNYVIKSQQAWDASIYALFCAELLLLSLKVSRNSVIDLSGN